MCFADADDSLRQLGGSEASKRREAIGAAFRFARSNAGRVADKARARGRQPDFADTIIAATALHHGLRLLTHNRGNFEPLGVAALDPCAALPP